MRLLRAIPLVLILFIGAALPAAAQAGSWLPAQPAENGLGGWWELNADGSAAYQWGALAEAHFVFDGDLLTVIPAGDRKDRPRYHVRFDQDRMFTRADEAGAPEAEYQRTQPATATAHPSGASAATPTAHLLGQWTSVITPKTSMAGMPGMADMPGMTGPAHDMPSVRTFTADGIYRVRIVYSTRRGHWDAVKKTITLDHEPEQAFTLSAGALVIAGTSFHAD